MILDYTGMILEFLSIEKKNERNGLNINEIKSKYEVNVLFEGGCAYLRHIDSGDKYLITSKVNKIELENNNLKIETKNSIYLFKIISEKGI